MALSGPVARRHRRHRRRLGDNEGMSTDEPQDSSPAPEPLGGEPACMLDRVCPECGLFAETALPAPCVRCGTLVGDSD